MAQYPAAVVENAFGVVARLRGARVFHPDGIYLTGRIRADSEFEHLFGVGEQPVTARLSKGTSMPAGLPDVLGLAFRVPTRDNRPWDFALATTGTGNLTRFLVTPTRGWRNARYGSLLPYRFDSSDATWIFAEPDRAQPDSASLDAMAGYVRENFLTFLLTASSYAKPHRKFAELTLRQDEAVEHPVDYFDPILHCPPGVRMVPDVVSTVRELAYTGSRRGRRQIP
ncbi:phosphodiesterase [Nocardia sp. NPDC051832]|uniref:phosphodiesterase n=1 Tax=Nocardia sp. NPDC051832 TaxID=3155673 RepID=UPI00341C4F67